MAAFAVVLALGVGALFVRAATLGNTVVQTLGVVPDAPVAPLAIGHEACQRPIQLAGGVDAVLFNPGTPAARLPAVEVLVRALGTGRVLSTGRLPVGADRTKPQTVRIGHLDGGRAVSLCFRNDGPVLLDVFGNPEGGAHGVLAATHLAVPSNTTSAAYVDGRPIPGDLTATFLRARPSSLLARLPAIVQRASVFRPGFVGPAAWWTLLACAALVVPLALGFALSRIARAPTPGGGR